MTALRLSAALVICIFMMFAGGILAAVIADRLGASAFQQKVVFTLAYIGCWAAIITLVRED